MDQPLVSIITPTYNHELFIAECIESVLAQTYPNWEQIIVDDGSTDQTWEIISEYARRDPRIKTFRQDNKGIWRLAETYNFALEQSKGSLIAVLEGDDYWPYQKLERQTKYHEKRTLLSYGVTSVVDKKGSEIRYLDSPPFVGKMKNWDYFKLMLLRKSAIQPVSVIISTEFIKSIGGFIQNKYPAVDFPTFIKLSKIDGEFVFTDDILGYWREHNTQITSTKGLEMIEGRLRISLDEYKNIPSSLQKKLCISESDIVAAHRKGLMDNYFFSIRHALKQHDIEMLNKYLPNLWKYGNTKRKLQASYAWLAIRFGWDMEVILHSYEWIAGYRR